jgi:hypothetical protein
MPYSHRELMKVEKLFKQYEAKEKKMASLMFRGGGNWETDLL